MTARLTWPTMLRAVRQIEQDGRTDLFDYITAFNAARDYMGERIPGPFGKRGHQVRLLAICIAAHAMRDELRQSRPTKYNVQE